MNFLKSNKTVLTFPNLPEAVANHPGIITNQQLQLLYGLSRDYYRGSGYIIGAGIFLGASTAALAIGLRDGGGINAWKGQTKPIIAFENAVAKPFHRRFAKKHNIDEIIENDSFESSLRNYISPYTKEVSLIIDDITECNIDDIKEIEICYTDVLKTKEMTNNFINIIFPRLIRDSYIIIQDYFTHDRPYLKVAIESFSDEIVFIGAVGSCAVFQIKNIIGRNLIDRKLTNQPLEKQLYLHKQAESHTNVEFRKYLMMLSRSLLILEKGDIARGKAVWSEADMKYPTVAFNEEGKYKNNILWRLKKLRRMSNDFEIRIADTGEYRSDISSLPVRNIKTIQKGTMQYYWRDVLCNKDPFDMALYQMLIWNVKPSTIIEIGTKEGGSALWMSDICNAHGLNTEIISIDIEQRAQFSKQNILFLQGDGRNLAPTFTEELLNKIRRPLLVIEDADHQYITTKSVLEFFDGLLKVGEYIVIEDGICDSLYNEVKYDGGAPRAIREFLTNNSYRYDIDEFYCDYFGFNITWNPNGYLKKVST